MNAKANILLLSAFAAALAGAETIVPWPDSWNCGITINGVNAGREIYGDGWRLEHGVLRLSGACPYVISGTNLNEAAPLDGEIVCAGFCTQSVRVSDYNETTGRTTARSITASMPFNLLGVDQGEPDWWADDWGEPE